MRVSTSEWQDLTDSTQDRMGDTERFRQVCSQIFAEMVQDRQFTRCPPIALRLYGANAMVCPSIGWSPRHCEALPDRVHVDVLVEVETELESQKAYKRFRAVKATLDPDEFRLMRINRSKLDAACDAFRTIAEEFIEDPRSVMARCSRQCCVCGRKLTEPESISRGIGPECVHRLGDLAFLTSMKPRQKRIGWR